MLSVCQLNCMCVVGLRTELLVPAFGGAHQDENESAGELSKRNCLLSFQKQGLLPGQPPGAEELCLKVDFTQVLWFPYYLFFLPRMLTNTQILFYVSTLSRFSATSKHREDQWF